ncbi:MAG: hypothetical protein HYX61_11615 [Gammaproteobacteria bacterium]|jgi:hypothetical protein|nr:hypothetical protein [Gammaproteobacteria bacterium]
MIRLLLFFAILGALFYAALAYGRHMIRRWQHSFTQPTQQKSLGEKLTQCPYCQTFVPTSQAYQAKGRYYCSKEHANL